MANVSTDSTTFYWHDYETFGADPARDRPCQFAGIRTDLDLNIIGDPLVVYCKPSNDFLPSPEACLITGITPQIALEKGIPEAEFISKIHAELSQPGTCGVGYNNIRFDDEFTRHSLYRNFFDPYAREWQQGNSRWDLLDIVRLTRALRPDGIHWPVNSEGEPSNRLEDLTKANGIEHASAHDALSDVYATIAVAKLIKQQQPKLFEYMFQMRHKARVLELLNIRTMQPIVHVSGMFPSEHGHTAIVVPIAEHPKNKNGVIVYDLSASPEPLIQLDVETIHQRLFTPRSELPEGTERIPLKTIHVNKCPVVAPLGTLTPEAAERLNISLELTQTHLTKIKQAKALNTKIQSVFTLAEFSQQSDPDLMLYSGGFFSPADRQRMDQVRKSPIDQLAQLHFGFDDRRLNEMLFRYRARNYPHTLSTEEQEIWEEYRIARITDPAAGAGIVIDDYYQQLNALYQTEDAKIDILNALADYADQLAG